MWRERESNTHLQTVATRMRGALSQFPSLLRGMEPTECVFNNAEFLSLHIFICRSSLHQPGPLSLRPVCSL